ncbi:MAG: sigma 54-interacting transcriptional regulator [Desulfobacterium sp.]|nr:sigma 54-interacting transcriptional regulator [Desulfobacterium sp.]
MNESKKFKFAFVSNSMEIAKRVKLFADPQREEVAIELATMEEALPVAINLLAGGVDVVLGGGATGRLLRKNLGQPVITVARTHLDILQALMKAQKIGHRIGLTSFARPTNGIDIFAGLLDMQIRQIVFNTTTELINGISKAIEEGIECIVGGGVCKEISASLGVEGFIIAPNSEVIERSFEEARVIAASQRKEREESERLRVILQTVAEGVIGIDAHGYVNLLNQTAAEFLDLDPQRVIGKALPEIFKGTGILNVLKTGIPDVDKIRRIGNTDIVINSIPINSNKKIKSVVSTFRKASRIQKIDRTLREKLYTKGLVAKYTLNDFKGQSRDVEQLRNKAAMYAATNVTILIQGETGTGKEILAQGIHNLSDRKNKPFVAINCSALPETLLESELFGYEEGAFTGAKKGGKIGLFELANEGTIFLDEIADIPPSLQARLLRVLEEKEVMRVGGDRVIRVDIRILSSTYKDLAIEVKEQRFRADLYFRLAVLRLYVPPLRNRKEDIPLLVHELLLRYTQGGKNMEITAGAMEQLQMYGWPGNVREMDALLKSYSALLGEKNSDQKLFQELFREVRENSLLQPDPDWEFSNGLDNKEMPTLKDKVEYFEKKQIDMALLESKFNRQEAARRLGISPNTLWRKSKWLEKKTERQDF